MEGLRSKKRFGTILRNTIQVPTPGVSGAYGSRGTLTQNHNELDAVIETGKFEIVTNNHIGERSPMYDEQTSIERNGKRTDRRSGVCNTEHVTYWLGFKHVPKLHSAECTQTLNTGSGGYSSFYPPHEISVSKNLAEIHLHLCGFTEFVQEEEPREQHNQTRRPGNLLGVEQGDESSKCVPSMPGSGGHKRTRCRDSVTEGEKDQGGPNQRIHQGHPQICASRNSNEFNQNGPKHHIKVSHKSEPYYCNKCSYLPDKK